MLNAINKYFKLSLIEKKMFFEALFTSLYARILIIIYPFNKIEKKMGAKTAQPFISENTKQEHLILIKKAILRASKYSLWRNKCFEQSLTATLMLKKRNIRYVLYLGLAKKENRLIAHVWIESNGYYIVNKGKIEYSTLSTYYG